jgi:hypothetical protein
MVAVACHCRVHWWALAGKAAAAADLLLSKDRNEGDTDSLAEMLLADLIAILQGNRAGPAHLETRGGNFCRLRHCHLRRLPHYLAPITPL